MSQSSILIGALMLYLLEREKERERNSQGTFFPGQICPVGNDVPGFSSSQVHLKVVLRVGPSILCAPNDLTCWLLLLWLEAIRITQV
jgi:hypothetical protein